MIKKIVIAAAGRGTRMLHLTHNKPKALINVNGKPFLYYLLNNILGAGYEELILVTGEKEEAMKEFLKKYRYKRVRIVNQFKILGKKGYGTACAVKAIKDILDGDDFVMVYGDNLYSIDDLRAFNLGGRYNYIGGIWHKNPEKYGVLVTENGFLKKIVEKPKREIGNLINTGLYKFTPEIFDKVSKIRKSKRGEYELTDAVNLLAKEKKVRIKRIKDFWFDFGNPADIIKLSRFIKASKKFD